MPRIVDIPGYGEVEFPDSMDETQVNVAAKKLYDDKVAETQQSALNRRAPVPIPEGLKPEPPKPPRSFTESLPAMGGGMAGASVGATYGGMIGGPVGAGVGALAGAGVGAFGGELLRQGIATAAGYKNQIDIPRAGQEATTNIIGEGLGMGLGAAARGVMNAVRPAARPIAQGVQSAAARGIPLTAADRSGGRVISTVESGVGRTLVGRPPLQRVAEEQSKAALENWWQPEILDAIAPHMDPTDVGTAVQQALGQSKDKVLGNVSRMFDTANEMAAKVQVPDTDIIAAARKFIDAPELKEAMRRAPSLADNSALKTLKEIAVGIPAQTQATGILDAAGNQITRTIPAKTMMPFETAEILRKQMESIVRDASTINPAVGRLKYLSGAVETTMREAMKNQAPDAYRIWKSARQLYGPAIDDLGSRGKDFGATALQKLARSHPEEVVSQIMKSGLSGIETAKKYLEFSPVWPQVQRAVLEESMQRSLTTESARSGPGLIRGAHWQSLFNKNLPALSKILSKDTMKQLEEFNQTVLRFRTAERLAGNASETGSALIAQNDMNTVIHLAQGGLALATFSENPNSRGMAGAATILLGPRVIANILSKPGGAQLLTQGMRVPQASGAAQQIAGRLAQYALESNQNAPSPEQEQ